MNAEQYIRTHTNEYNDCENDDDFKWIEFNGIDVYLFIDGEEIMFNITKLHKALNSCTKSSNSNGSIFVKRNIIDKEWKQLYPSKFYDAYGEGTQKFKGMYASLDLLSVLLVSMAGIHGYQWFINDKDWFESSGAGYVYLINVPEHRDQPIYKYGRTINLECRFNGYLHEAKKLNLHTLGINIIAQAYVDNQSKAEDDIGKLFDEEGFKPTGTDREYRLISDCDDRETACEIAWQLFHDALVNNGVDEKAIQHFDEGSNVYRYKRDLA